MIYVSGFLSAAYFILPNTNLYLSIIWSGTSCSEYNTIIRRLQCRFEFVYLYKIQIPDQEVYIRWHVRLILIVKNIYAYKHEINIY